MQKQMQKKQKKSSTSEFVFTPVKPKLPVYFVRMGKPGTDAPQKRKKKRKEERRYVQQVVLRAHEKAKLSKLGTAAYR